MSNIISNSFIITFYFICSIAFAYDVPRFWKMNEKTVSFVYASIAIQLFFTSITSITKLIKMI